MRTTLARFIGGSLLAVLALGALYPLATEGARRTTGLPDLQIDGLRAENTVSFEIAELSSSDCAVVEGCVDGTGPRYLMRFDVAIQNRGTADLVIGRPRNHPEWFEFSPCHGHYHFTGFVEYKLYTLDGEGNPGDFVVAGRKQAFCLEDFEPIPGVGTGKPRYWCSNQGIRAGWQDVYRAALDCQWLDVTDVPPGQYALVITADAENKFVELDDTNNSGIAFVTIEDPSQLTVGTTAGETKRCCGQ